MATAVGAEGLDVGGANPAPLRIADDPRDFAAAVIALLRDPGERAALGRSAREHVARFDWRAFVPLLEAAYATG